MKPNQPIRLPDYFAQHTGVEGFDALVELALDLRWAWNHAADEIWRHLDSQYWDLTRNPWGLLQLISREQVEKALGDRNFRAQVDRLLSARRKASRSPKWFQKTYPRSRLKSVVYFSMEFMLSEALPIYSGGLGNVAGDQLKAANDLGVPVIGVGLLYQQGYFRQNIDGSGNQEALFPYNEPGQLPISPVRRPDGEWLRLSLDLGSEEVWIRAWQARIGNLRLYLLDSNDLANIPSHRKITSELYGGGPELRLRQELVLGIGGWRLVEELGLDPEVCHLNEGHAAFAVLERARSFMEKTGHPFDVALTATRAGNFFTTHTAVPAGFDRFDPGQIETRLASYAEKALGVSLKDLLALGRQNPDDPSEPFNMAYLAMRGSGAVNGVSRLHGRVSRELLGPLFPRWPLDEVPVGHITNGVHVATWDSQPSDELWTRVCGPKRWTEPTEAVGEVIRKASDADLWKLRNDSRASLIEYVRKRLVRERTLSGAPEESIREIGNLFDPDLMMLGFARRFATYKRPNLLLSDPGRLLGLLEHPDRPVQLVIAGKAHPADLAGQAMLREWIQFVNRREIRFRAVFLSDYDMLLAERLVQGVDVWINTPRRPWEACGTSGMKVLVNGGLNLSTLDGWWEEAYAPEAGWAIGDGLEHGDDQACDASEARELYDRLEREVVPAFYRRDGQGIPPEWVARMRESMSRLTPEFSANRSVRQYVERHYLPAADAYRKRTSRKGEFSRKAVVWRKDLDEKWNSVRFGALGVEDRDSRQVFSVEVDLAGLDPDGVRVELFANGREGKRADRWTMKTTGIPDPVKGCFLYLVDVPEGRSWTDYTPRIVAHHEGLSVPLEAPHILWQR